MNATIREELPAVRGMIKNAGVPQKAVPGVSASVYGQLSNRNTLFSNVYGSQVFVDSGGAVWARSAASGILFIKPITICCAA